LTSNEEGMAVAIFELEESFENIKRGNISFYQLGSKTISFEEVSLSQNKSPTISFFRSLTAVN